MTRTPESVYLEKLNRFLALPAEKQKAVRTGIGCNTIELQEVRGFYLQMNEQSGDECPLGIFDTSVPANPNLQME